MAPGTTLSEQNYFAHRVHIVGGAIVFTLIYDESAGVVLKLLWLELPALEPRKQRTAT